jgi:putative tryptophan/tyrosine transport system substrate-binding protein
MTRRTFLCGLTLGTLASPLAVKAQPASGKVYRVGILSAGGEPSPPSSFRQSLADSGYVEGANLSFVYRWADGDFERLPALAAELVRLGVDVLFSISTLAIRALAEATTTTPIVAISVADPVDAGFVASLARPGGNVTGVTGRVLELNEKLLQFLKESTPSASRVAVLGGPTQVARDRKRMEDAARSLKVQLQFVEVASRKELEAAFEVMAKARAEGVVVIPTVLLALNQSRIAALALQRRLPSIFWASEFAEAGGLMAFGPDWPYMSRRAGALIARILKGARPADLPMEQADRFRLVINLKTANALGLTIPQSVLVRADEILQ